MIKVEYRPPMKERIPSADSINGEPIWAEVMDPTEDLAVLYVTCLQTEIGAKVHIWHAYATDDPGATEFFTVEEYQIKPGEQAEFPTLSKAIAEIAGYVQQ